MDLKTNGYNDIRLGFVFLRAPYVLFGNETSAETKQLYRGYLIEFETIG